MDKLDHNYRSKEGVYDVHGLNGFRVEFPALLVIKLPDSWVLRIMSRSVFLVLLALPLLYSMINSYLGGDLSKHGADPRGDNEFKILPLLLRDMLDEGLIKKGQNGLRFGAGFSDDDLGFLRDAGVELLTGADLRTEKMVSHQVFNFVITTSFHMIQKIDEIVKDDDLVISPLADDPSDDLKFLNGYKIVYLRRFESTVVAMKKMKALGTGKDVTLHSATLEEKKTALKGLEDVYLEPPTRAALQKQSSFTSRKIKFLPDLLRVSLDEYPRRIFVSDELSSLDWFYKNYPMRDQEFEVYTMDPQETGVSNWLENKVQREDYVVMKAEAQVVEEMLQEKTIYLIDELFLECNKQWQDGARKRAYWQCLELYGKVWDEGIAVHQWWDGLLGT